MITDALLTEALHSGHTVWAVVNYEDMAKAIRDRLNKENPRHAASIGLLPDNTYVIWYRNQHGGRPKGKKK